MCRTIAIACLAMGVLSTTASVDAFAAARCSSVKARCAVQIGGVCDPSTGRWDVNQHGAGGTVRAFIACLDRERGARHGI
jgi:hypothetical protein